MTEGSRTAKTDLLSSVAMTSGAGSPLAKARHAKGWTLDELARRSGVHYVTISRIENGEDRNRRVETFQRLAAALDVPLESIITSLPESPADAKEKTP